jgi:hypothetical protein
MIALPSFIMASVDSGVTEGGSNRGHADLLNVKKIFFLVRAEADG